ncbi:MAG: prepilin-type N-terminal cleavage/methylation domain-containing protein [Candidatus Kerfeldbacteria bacterium]|nr:prepilin-type N-terminal cleavage/methylation domain-containing protein [Candidatus Kerfeldbacteria bacterium]
MRRQTGISLVEIMVAISILTVVGIVVGTIYINAGRFTQTEQLKVDVDLSANRVLATLNEHLRQGKAVLPSYSTYTTGPTTLVFSVPSQVGGAPSQSTTDTYVLYLDAGVLSLLIDADESSSRTDQTVEITRNVKDVYFRYTTSVPTAATGVTVTITTEKNINGQAYTQASILNATFLNHP